MQKALCVLGEAEDKKEAELVHAAGEAAAEVLKTGRSTEKHLYRDTLEPVITRQDK